MAFSVSGIIERLRCNFDMLATTPAYFYKAASEKQEVS